MNHQQDFHRQSKILLILYSVLYVVIHIVVSYYDYINGFIVFTKEMLL